jgi:cyclohexa-1,5-dienecarbonyl-CoA hydratase
LHLTLNAPKANILDSNMLAGFRQALDSFADSPHLKAIVFEGEGNHFCFGASVQEHQADQAAAMLQGFHGFFRRLAHLNIPTVAIVRGQCLGGGLELASYCSWIFASPNARFGQPEIKLAVFPPMASILLPWRVGAGHAMDLCVSGRSISADDAKRIGLVHTVADDPGAAFAEFFAEHLQPLIASSLRIAEEAVRRPLTAQLQNELPAIEELYLERLMQTHDANEGIAAFLEKRTPVYGDTSVGES